MATDAIPAIAAIAGPALAGLFGGNPGKKTRKMMRKLLERLLPQIEAELKARYANYRDLYGTSVPFLKGLIPTSFDKLSPYASSLRDQMLQSFLSQNESARVGGLGTLNRKFGFRAPAGAYATFLGDLARNESSDRTDIRRQAVQENTRMGLVGSEGLRAWAGQGDPLQGTLPFAQLAAATGLQSQGGFGANLDFAGILKALQDSGIFTGKQKGGNFGQASRSAAYNSISPFWFNQFGAAPGGPGSTFYGLGAY